MTKNLNPFSLDKKLNDPNNHEMIHMIWKECMPVAFYKFICKGEKFIYLNGNVLLPKVSPKRTSSVRLFNCVPQNKLCNGNKRFLPEEHISYRV